jgi:hypothetical protein
MQTINITLFTNNFGSSFSTTIFGRITRCCCKKHHSTNTMADEDDRWLVGWFSLFDSWSGGSLFDVVACFSQDSFPVLRTVSTAHRFVAKFIPVKQSRTKNLTKSERLDNNLSTM